MQTLSFKESVPTGEYDLFDLIEIGADLGYDGVDLEDRQLDSTDPEYLERLRLHALRLGMPIGYFGVGGGFGQGWRGDDDGHVAHIKDWIGVARAMQVPLLRLIGCAPEPGESEEDAWPRLAGHFRELTAFARQRKVVLGLHNHNHGMFPAISDQVVRMLDEIDDPYFVHILDTGQYRGSRGASKYDEDPNRDDYDLYANIAGSIDRAVLVRAKIYAIGSGSEEWIDYPRVMSILKKSGFRGWLSVVFEGRDGTPPMEAMKLARTYLRRLLREYEIG